jgi:hypothetical protein
MAKSTAAKMIDGIGLGHDITGAPRNLLHRISVAVGSPEPDGYSYSYGWKVGDGFHWKVCYREVPLPKEAGGPS